MVYLWHLVGRGYYKRYKIWKVHSFENSYCNMDSLLLHYINRLWRNFEGVFVNTSLFKSNWYFTTSKLRDSESSKNLRNRRSLERTRMKNSCGQWILVEMFFQNGRILVDIFRGFVFKTRSLSWNLSISCSIQGPCFDKMKIVHNTVLKMNGLLFLNCLQL